MPVLMGLNGEIIVGGLAYDPVRGTIRAAREVADVLFERMVIPAFGSRLSGRFPTIMSYPVPNRPDRAWVIMILRRGVPDDQPLSVRWVERAGKRDELDGLIVAVGQVSPRDALPAGPIHLPPVMGRPSGVFRFHPAILSADGSLILPGTRISTDMAMKRYPAADWSLQGVYPIGHHILPVSGFLAHHPWGWQKPLHPMGLPDLRKDNRPSPAGFLLWADPSRGHALWAIADDVEWGIGRLEMVDIRSMEILWVERDIRLDMAVATPDGRWAAVQMFGWSSYSGRMEIRVLTGFMDRFAVSRGLKIPDSLLGISPLSGERWVIASDSWLLIVRGKSVEEVLEIPLAPILHVPGMTVTLDRDSISMIPEEKIPLSAIRDHVFQMRPERLETRNGLGIIADRTGERFALVPSGRVVKTSPAYTTIQRNRFVIGRHGYVISDFRIWRGSEELSLLFYGRDGRFSGSLRVGDAIPDDLIDVIPVLDGFLVFVRKYPRSLLLFLCDSSGNAVQMERIGIPSGSFRVVRKTTFRDGVHIIFKFENIYEEKTFCATVLDGWEMLVSVVV